MDLDECHHTFEISDSNKRPIDTFPHTINSSLLLEHFLYLYREADASGLYRESEYIATLAIHLLKETPLLKGIENNSKDVFSSITQNKNFHSSNFLQESTISIWSWRYLRSLFQQKRYTCLLTHIDLLCSDAFVVWSLNAVAPNHTQKTLTKKNSQELNAIENQLTPQSITTFTARCGFLRCLALKELGLFPDFIEFSTTFLNRLDALYTENNETCKQTDDEYLFLSKHFTNSLKARTLALQGQVLDKNAAPDAAVKKYVSAAEISLEDVFWVLPKLICAYCLSEPEEFELLTNLSNGLTSDDIYSPKLTIEPSACSPLFSERLCYWLRETLLLFKKKSLKTTNFGTSLTAMFPGVPCVILQSPMFLQIIAKRSLQIGYIDHAELITKNVLESNPLNFSCVRILIELLYLNCWDKTLHPQLFSVFKDRLTSSSANLENTSATRYHSDYGFSELILTDRLKQLGTFADELAQNFPERAESYFAKGLYYIRSGEQMSGYEELRKTKRVLESASIYEIDFLLNMGKISEARNLLETLLLSKPYCPTLQFHKELCIFYEELSTGGVTPALSTTMQEERCNPFYIEFQGDKAVAALRWDVAYLQYSACLTILTESDAKNSQVMYLSDYDRTKLQLQAHCRTSCWSQTPSIYRFDLARYCAGVPWTACLGIRVALKAAVVAAVINLGSAARSAIACITESSCFLPEYRFLVIKKLYDGLKEDPVQSCTLFRIPIPSSLSANSNSLRRLNNIISRIVALFWTSLLAGKDPYINIETINDFVQDIPIIA